MIWIMIMMIVALALIGVPMSFSMLTGSVWFMLTSGMPQTLMIQRRLWRLAIVQHAGDPVLHARGHDHERRRRGDAYL